MSAMLLVLDLGNSRFKWALTDGRAWTPGAAYPYGPDFAAALVAALGGVAPPQAAAFVSVTTPERVTRLEQWLKVRWGIEARRLSASTSALGVTNGYAQPERLGADRWAALVAARAQRAGAVCVVDAGTAVTVDALDAGGAFRGGVILPGLALQRAALQHGTEGAGVVPSATGSCLARDTAAAVAGGTLYGLAGAVDRILDEQAQALGASPAVLVTGGDGARLLPLLRHAAEPMPDLVLRGVARLSGVEVAV